MKSTLLKFLIVGAVTAFSHSNLEASASKRGLSADEISNLFSGDEVSTGDTNCAVQRCINQCGTGNASWNCPMIYLFCGNTPYNNPTDHYVNPDLTGPQAARCRAEGCRIANNPGHISRDPGCNPRTTTGADGNTVM